MSNADPTGDLIGELVHQFTDRFAFYRELIQNSIDAGSSRIEVRLRYKPDVKAGLMTATVEDWGEGMDRRIIEDFLLTKFRSSKEGDLTKIGKFGIGFLSVFAPAPDLVVVETGRNGEDWRILFYPDRTYELLKCPDPVEGTRVDLHKEMSVSEYRDFRASSLEAVKRWCRHSDADVTFAAGGEDGSPPSGPISVREPLRADAPFQVEHRDDHTLIVAGPARTDPPLCGFYNRGLTLLETREALVARISFKVVSDLLEHTLTRDNVRRDRAFERILDRVGKLASGPIKEKLAGELEAAAVRPDNAELEYKALLEYARGVLPKDALSFPVPGGAASGRALREAAQKIGMVIFGEADRPVVQALARQQLPVITPSVGLRDAVLTAAAEAAGAHARHAEAVFTLAEHGQQVEGEEALCSSLLPLLKSCGVRIERIVVATVRGAGANRFYVMVSKLGIAEPCESTLRSPFGGGATPPLLCLNRASLEIVKAARLAVDRPALASYLCARLLAASESALDEHRDRRLTAAALGA